MNIRYAMAIDLEKCVGCHACEMACKLENKVPVSTWRIWVKEGLKGKNPQVVKAFLPVLCNHCENPSCVTVCPVKAALRRDDGIVTVDPHRCIGCGYCMGACPYAQRHINPFIGIVQKCDFCIHRIEKGHAPACLLSCPNGAMIFGDINDKNSEIYKFITTHRVSVLKDYTGNKPQVFYASLDTSMANTKGMPE
jgi:tetrathionate reductase subunit B